MTTERPPNVLMIMSDQHNPRAMGHSPRGIGALTPNLDRLAEEGTSFSSAYCTSPICVPARASIATGRYVHELGMWDNAEPYPGTPPSWGHYLGEAGYRVVTVGKLHHADSDDDTGFPDQRLAMQVHNGGDLRGVSLRPERRSPPAGKGLNNLLNAGPGESEYTEYDRAVAREAIAFLNSDLTTSEQPWALMVSFVAPHFPLIAPHEFHDLYDPADLPIPPPDTGAWDHPAVSEFKTAFGLTRDLTETETRTALAAYLGLCSFLDHNVGLVLDALAASGTHDDTVVIYTSDHGESAGAHGLWFKHLMNEESVGVPLLMRGPGIPRGRTETSPVSHVDLVSTMLDVAGVTPPPELAGTSLRAPADDRTIMAEYHANGSVDAYFMVRHGEWKYIEYVHGPPQLFNLAEDPGEHRNLASSPDYAAVLADFGARLRQFCDPAAVDRAAKASQAERVARVGGVEAAARITVPYTPPPK